MTTFVALLRAVNVGGHGNLPMAKLKAICEAAGFGSVRTYIASGNVVFLSDLAEAGVKRALEAGLKAEAGAPIGVLVRSATEMAAIVAANPFAKAPGNRAVVVFLDAATSTATLAGLRGQAEDEEVRLGRREIYIRYGAAGQVRSKLRIPAAASGTARNMNTVARLAAMAAE